MHLSWARSDSADVVAYRFFCDVPSTLVISHSDVVGCHATDAGADTVAPFQCGQVQGGAATSGVVDPLTPDVLHTFLVASVDEVGNVSGHDEYCCATPIAPPPEAPQSSGCGCMLPRAGRSHGADWGPLVIASLLAAARRRQLHACAFARLRNMRRHAPDRLVLIQVARPVSTRAALSMNSRAE